MAQTAVDSLKEQIVGILRERGSRILSLKDIAARLSAPLDQEELEDVVHSMEREGTIVAIRGKRYSLLEFTSFESGRVRTHPDGYATVFRADRERPPLYVDRRALRGAMNGDVVLLRLEREPKTRRILGRLHEEAEVVRVLQRSHRLVVGRFHDGEFPFVRPFDVRLDSDLDIDADDTLDAVDGEMVNVEIDRYPDHSSIGSGRVVERLGFIGDPGVDIEVVIRKFSIPHRFQEDVLRAAEAIPLEITENELARRTDLRERAIVTIDGETAKDFDDAVEVERLAGGEFRLGVHIADVAHYVTEGSLLDREAFERGTSVYFPGRAVPMLPERLSNGICSLNPRVDRLTFSVSVRVDSRGRFHDRRIFKSVIRTQERMTYTAVNAILTAPTPELEERYGALLDHFGAMHELFGVLRARRDARGSIDFDLPEAEVHLDKAGDIETIRPSERNVAHRIIEEFMLAANEIVAQELFFTQQPAVYRVHQQPEPERLADLKLVLKELGHPLRGDPEQIRPADLQKVLVSVAGTPEERFLTEIILRTMKRAIYLEECTGHFALALQHYCHFTSPIRRYPDLIVHRRLAELIVDGPALGERLEELEATHPVLASQSSEREKRAEDAEREVLEWKKVIFMRDKIGLEFTGRITGVTSFGLFVELDDFFVQGLVPMASIGGDYWRFKDRQHRLEGEQSGREFRLGDKVRVEVREIDEDRRQIGFRLLEAGGAPIARREREGSGRRRSSP